MVRRGGSGDERDKVVDSGRELWTFQEVLDWPSGVARIRKKGDESGFRERKEFRWDTEEGGPSSGTQPRGKN